MVFSSVCKLEKTIHFNKKEMIENKSYLLISLLLVIFSSCQVENITCPIIPQPNSIIYNDGYFTLSKNVSVYTNFKNIKKISNWTNSLGLDKVISIPNIDIKEKSIHLFIDNDFDKEESYQITISQSTITIISGSESGLFYAIQSLIQLKENYHTKIPAMLIKDSPRFAVRCLMLDASSFYLSPTFIKKQIDAMAYYKLNRLQLLLGGEGGWRIPIQGYPNLIEKTAWRTKNNFLEMKMQGGEFCLENSENAHGGYYTHEEIQDLISYAAHRNITILPAIDLPDAHFDIASRAGLSTTEVEQKLFIKSALTSLIDLFPSEYIYIGNGKADDSFGTACESCRKKVDDINTLDQSEPYSLILQEASSFLKSKGKILITWEESLRMKLDEAPQIIAWHDKDDGINAAKRKHKTTLAPARNTSLNFYQSDPTNSPKAMSGFLPLEKVYEFNVSVTDSIISFIDGVQINMWTHNIDSEAKIEYQLYPRLLAFAEVGWTNPVQKSYLNFKQRILQANKILSKKKYNYFNISQESTRRKEQSDVITSISKYKPIIYESTFSSEFPAKGVGSLTDGIRGGWHYSDGNWQGFAGNKMSVIIDLEEETNIQQISADFIKDKTCYVYLPKVVNLYTSNDGQKFEMLGVAKNETAINDHQEYQIVNYTWSGEAKTRYVKYEAIKVDSQISWLFTDEIIIL